MKKPEYMVSWPYTARGPHPPPPHYSPTQLYSDIQRAQTLRHFTLSTPPSLKHRKGFEIISLFFYSVLLQYSFNNLTIRAILYLTVPKALI
jgi:hypothetical protein